MTKDHTAVDAVFLDFAKAFDNQVPHQWRAS